MVSVRVAAFAVVLLSLPWALLTAPPAAAQEVPELGINSKRYIVIDAETGEVYAQRRADEKVAIASLTKIYTAILAIEQADPSYTITTKESDLQGPEASVMGFDPGETFTLEDLLHGLMLPSGNDAAFAIARAIGYEPGDDDETAVQRFMDRANQRLRDMGMTDTNLVRPDGWGVPNHHSSARDLATFTMYALQFPRFERLISSQTYETANGYSLRNNNRMFAFYDDLVGGKTGYDNDSGWCLVEVARRGEDTMISVTLDGVHPDDWYDDNVVLLDYAFEQKAKRRAMGHGIPAGATVLDFKDPDAAVIARSAEQGVSLGQPGALAAPGAIGGGGLTTGSRPRLTPADRGSGLDDQLVAAVGVAAVVILGGALSAFRRAPRPQPTDPASPGRAPTGFGERPIASPRPLNVRAERRGEKR